MIDDKNGRKNIESMAGGVWARRFGIDDDFFELGGNSLMAMRIYMKLSEEVAGLEIDDFFECLSVRAIAKKVDGKIEQ